jgi:thermitase
VLLVRFRPRVARAARVSAAADIGGRVVRTIPQINTQAIAVGAGREGEAGSALMRRPDVASVERDPIAYGAGHVTCEADAGCLIPNDPLFSRQWGLSNSRATDELAPNAVFGADIGAPAAWAYSKGSAAVRIAIVDSGIDDHHPDLGAKIVDESTLPANHGDAVDHLGHGTAVAGVAGAIPNNGIGIAGVGYNSSLMEVKVTDDQSSRVVVDCGALAAGIVYAAAHGAHVINVSFDGPHCAAEDQAVKYASSKDALVVASAGNDGTSTLNYPAALPEVVSVGATDNTDRRASFSSYGASWVDIAAPGATIETTLPHNANGMGQTDYGLMEGTSFASPMVAGAAALIWPTVSDTNHDGFVSDEVMGRLLAYADRTPGTGTDWRAGRLNVCRALTADKAPCPPSHAKLPTMKPGEANGYARQLLDAAFKRRFTNGHAYSRSCERSSRTRFLCTIGWHYGPEHYRGTVTVWYAPERTGVYWYGSYVIRTAGHTFRASAARSARARRVR